MFSGETFYADTGYKNILSFEQRETFNLFIILDEDQVWFKKKALQLESCSQDEVITYK